MRCEKYGETRYRAVYDDAEALVAVVVYKKGAKEVLRRLEKLQSALERPMESRKSE